MTKDPVCGMTVKVAGLFLPAVLAISVLTFSVWLWLGTEQSSHTPSATPYGCEK